MCGICNCEKKRFRQCVKCENKLGVECFKNHNEEYINTCPYCRYSLLYHSRNRTILSKIGDFQCIRWYLLRWVRKGYSVISI